MTGSVHENWIGIGVKRTTYKKLRRAAKKRKLSISALVAQMVGALTD